MSDGAVALMKVIFTLMCCVSVCSGVPDSNATFEEIPPNYEVFEGNNVQLICQQEEQGPIYVSHKGVAIIENSTFVGSQSKYKFIYFSQSSTFTLTVQNVDRIDEGRYFCAEGKSLIKQLYLQVLYNPKSGPNCTSSYGSSTYFFDDEHQKTFHFNCTVEEGNPPIEFLLYKKGNSTERLTTDEVALINSRGKYPQRTLTFSSYLDNSFNNTRLLCNINQNMPSAFVDYDFNKTCFYGPMILLSSFDISVIPSNATVREGQVTRITCNSNVSEAEKSWHNIPGNLEYETVKDENGLHLIILEMKGVEGQTITVVCESIYGHRRLSAKVTLSKEQYDNIHEKTSSVAIAVAVVFSVIFILMVAILVFCGYQYRRKPNFFTNITDIYERHVKMESRKPEDVPD